MYEIGARMTAISSANSEEKKVYIFGSGTYEGYHIPTGDVAGMGQMLREARVKNPKIKLDSGECVYGCECWWGPEDRVKSKYEGFEFVEVSITDARKSAETT